MSPTMDLSLYPMHERLQYASMNPYIILLMIAFLSLTHTKKEVLDEIPILVKLNIIESQAKKELRKFRKKMKELRPDIFKQTWLGTFNYSFCGHKIVGTVELRCNIVFSVAENQEWLFNDTSNVKDIIYHLSHNRLTQIPGWDSHSAITCQIILHDSHMMRHLFTPHDILTDRHSHQIKWEKKLVS